MNDISTVCDIGLNVTRQCQSARMSKITNDRLNPVWHRMLYSRTHMATVGVKGLQDVWSPDDRLYSTLLAVMVTVRWRVCSDVTRPRRRTEGSGCR